nr:HNH endonuclease [Ligilactobacillus agilis]
MMEKKDRIMFYHSKGWAALRQQALSRDNYECLWCKEEGRVSSGTLEVDHIKDLEHYPELALNLDNLRTLCKDHHNQRHHRMEYSSKAHRKTPKWDDERWD